MCTGMAGRVMRLYGAAAEVDVDGRTVPVALVVLDEPVALGDWLLVHSGLAVRRLSASDVRLLRLVRGEPR